MPASASSPETVSARAWHWTEEFYVDPVDDVLKDSEAPWRSRGLDLKPWRRKRPEPDPDICPLDEMRELGRIGGLCYEIGYANDPMGGRHAASKRQLSKAELRTFQIANEHQQ